jgi:hypothetical protein
VLTSSPSLDDRPEGGVPVGCHHFTVVGVLGHHDHRMVWEHLAGVPEHGCCRRVSGRPNRTRRQLRHPRPEQTSLFCPCCNGHGVITAEVRNNAGDLVAVPAPVPGVSAESGPGRDMAVGSRRDL